MDEPLKTLYERELQHLEGHAQEFAERQKYEKLAARLGLGSAVAVRDPFVEWLLEGFAYLAARVQLKLDQEFPRFTQNLLSVVYPHLSAQTPSMIVAELTPDPNDAALMDGPAVAKGVRLRARVSGPERKEIPYLTGRSIRLWPLEIGAAEYLSDRAAVSARAEALVVAAETDMARAAELRADSGRSLKVESGLALKLDLKLDGTLRDCAADELDVFFSGPPSVANGLFEACLMSCARVHAVIPAARRGAPARHVPLTAAPLGFEKRHRPDGLAVEEDALLPYDLRSFDGYRLLHEFFALPERFQFMRISGLQRAFQAAEGKSIEIVFAFNAGFEALRGRVGKEHLRLHCVPAVNLFPHQADDVRLTNKAAEHHLIPDRGAPADYEIHSVTSVVGRGEGDERQAFLPFFSTRGMGARDAASRRYFALNRVPREAPVTADGDKRLKEYRGDEVYISLVDADCAPFDPKLRRISVATLCTSRHLPLYIGGETAQLTSDSDLGCTSIRIAAGPSHPRSGVHSGARMWQTISHLSLNYLSLIDTENGGGDAALRALLNIYAPPEDRAARRLSDALRAVSARPVSGRLQPPEGGGLHPIAFGRGLEVRVTLDERQERTPVLAAVLDRFLASYAGANSFTRLKIAYLDGQERAIWPTRSGTKPIL